MSSTHILTEDILIGLSLWKEKRYEFITDTGDYEVGTDGKLREIKRHQKQYEALYLLTDNETVELAYGGAAGGAKSWTGCTWLMFQCLEYAGTRWFIGREELKRLRDSTLQTFFKVALEYGLRKGIDYEYKAKDNYILFYNGSRIDLLDLKYLPTDPLFERYGSVEYTGGWIEEGGEVHFAAFDTLKSRVGRHLNDKYNLLRKILVTCNPKKNWIYTYFYKPDRNNDMPKGRKFLKALLGDNPHRESGYEEALKSITDPIKKARLLDGNFEYDDDPSLLCEYDAIDNVFRNEHVKRDGKKYISADLAMQGRDKFIAGVWDGYVCDLTKGIYKDKSTGKSIEQDLKQLMVANGVTRSNTVVDSDGLGNYLESYLEGIVEFHGGQAAYDNKEYANWKSECAYALADAINKGEIYIICTAEQRELIIEELGMLRAKEIDADEKRKRIISKKEMKELLGRSPDLLDMLIMRFVFKNKKKKVKIYSID